MPGLSGVMMGSEAVGPSHRMQDSQVVELHIQVGGGYMLDLFTQGKRIPQIQTGHCR